jgi:hypothetical protein
MFSILVSYSIAIPLRQSPQVSESIAASIRSGVVLPVSRLMKKSINECDSLKEGPFCRLINDLHKPITNGLIEIELWGDVPPLVYESNYKVLADYAQNHWSGNPTFRSRKPLLAHLQQSNDPGRLSFRGHPLEANFSGFSESPTSAKSLYILNSIYGYISFVDEVSVTEFSVFAPTESDILVRTFQDGVPIWSRVVAAGSEVDVAMSCELTDPAMEPVDYIEIIGRGAEVVSLSISLPTDRFARTYLFMDSNLRRPSKYAGIRSFAPSAYVIDMESAVNEGLVFKETGILKLLQSALNSPVMSSQWLLDRLLKCATADNAPHLSQLDHLLRVLDRQYATSEDDFETTFRDVLVESAPELVAFVLHKECLTSIVSPRVADIIRRLRTLRGDVMSLPTDDADTLIEEIANPLVTFQRLIDPPTSDLLSAANKVALAMYAHLGGDRFAEIVVRNKLVRIANSQPVTGDGVDEDALAAVLIQGLELPINDGTPEQSKIDILTKIIDILTQGDPAGASKELAALLANYP